MRLLRVIHSLAAAGGGPAESVRQFSAALTQLGVTTEVASLDDRTQTVRIDGVERIWCLGPGRGSYGFSRRLDTWLDEHVRRFDGVVIQGLWNYPSLATWRALQRWRRQGAKVPPYWVYPHGMLDPWFKRAHPLKHLKKAVYWRLAEHRVLRDAEAVLFTADEERLRARQSFSPYQCREAVVPHGIHAPPTAGADLSETFLQARPELRGKRLLLYLGRLHPKKGPELAIEGFCRALQQHPEAERTAWTLVMAGPASGTGVDEGYLRRLQAHATGQAVVFPGLLQGELKWGAFHACEAFLLPSHQENFGIAVVEALACGKPVLISDQVNIWREIEAAGAAFVAPDTLEGTESLLQRWMSLPDAERAAMSQNARQCFEARFEIRRAAERFLEVVRRVTTDH